MGINSPDEPSRSHEFSGSASPEANRDGALNNVTGEIRNALLLALGEEAFRLMLGNLWTSIRKMYWFQANNAAELCEKMAERIKKIMEKANVDENNTSNDGPVFYTVNIYKELQCIVTDHNSKKMSTVEIRKRVFDIMVFCDEARMLGIWP